MWKLLVHCIYIPQNISHFFCIYPLWLIPLSSSTLFIPFCWPSGNVIFCTAPCFFVFLHHWHSVECVIWSFHVWWSVVKDEKCLDPGYFSGGLLCTLLACVSVVGKLSAGHPHWSACFSSPSLLLMAKNLVNYWARARTCWAGLMGRPWRIYLVNSWLTPEAAQMIQTVWANLLMNNALTWLYSW